MTNAKKERFIKILESAYSQENFVDFSKEFFVDIKLVAPNLQKHAMGAFCNYIEGYYHIGNYQGKDGNRIAVFSIALKRDDLVNRARGIQRNFVKQLMQSGNCAGALVAFYTMGDLNKWRLSFVRLDYEFSRGKITEKLTPAKRYSYLVGEKEPSHTAQERLFPIFENDKENPSLDDLEDAFSVERVTKEFYEKYCEKYLQLKEWLESNEDFVLESQTRGFTSEQFAKKLLGQIVFLYFVQKKGWLGVNPIKMILEAKEYDRIFYKIGGKRGRELLPTIYEKADDYYKLDTRRFLDLNEDDAAYVAKIVKGSSWGSGPKDFVRWMFNGCVNLGKNYFDDYLEPLFYTGLNVDRGQDAYFHLIHRRVPFLNGGLFEELDNYDWKNNNFAIPNEIFSNQSVKGKKDADGILDIFDRYNFTMNEDEPLECEVAIDPEMLGKVFENLLDVKDRKSKGAFYTPREIVHYMCQETLVNYLSSHLSLPESHIRDFILFGDLMKDEDLTKDAREGKKDLLISEEIFSIKKGINRIKELDNLLSNVKVLDLAVGSGAFPLGMINEIVRARETLTAYMSLGMNGFDKKILYANRKPYYLKCETIKNCIFACDIEPSAVDIAKLRLWLSIIIDDELVETVGDSYVNRELLNEHTKPEPLPNLDCNIMCGNSLIDEFKGNKLITESQLLANVKQESQINIFQMGVDTLLAELISLQDKLFYTKGHNEKVELNEKISQIYNQIVFEQGIKENPELCEQYIAATMLPSKPFVLWQLYFPRVFRDNGGFDIVIGNPPYIDSEGMVNSGLEWERDYIAKNYKYAKGNWDIYISFFEKGLSLLNTDGRLMFITPDKWISKPFGTALRQGEVDHFIQIMEVGRDVFESALVDSIVTMIGRRSIPFINVFSMRKSEGVAHFVRKVDKSILNEDCALDIVFSAYTDYVEKMSEGRKFLGEFYECENACATSDCYILKDILHSHESEAEYNDREEYKVINTGTIGRYVSRWGHSPMKYLKDKYEYPYVKREEFHSTFPKSYGEKPRKKKVVIKGLTLLDGTLDFVGEIVPGKSTMIIPVDYEDELKVVGAYINSRLSIFYIKQRYSSSSYNGGINFTKDMINNLPWIELDDDTRNQIINIVDQIISAKKENIETDTSDLERQIDEIYFSLFGFGDEEIEAIDKIFIK